jgi:hypothetical protein
MTGSQLHGVICSISETEHISEKFCKRNFTLTIDHDRQYPQPLKFELHNDRCDLIDSYREGDEVSVDFNFRGREFEDRNGQLQVMNTLVVWKIPPVNKKS